MPARIAGTATGVAVGDLNGDGTLDVIIARMERGCCMQLHPMGTGWRCGSVQAFDTDQVSYSTPVVADVDGDGHLDVIIAAGNLW